MAIFPLAQMTAQVSRTRIGQNHTWSFSHLAKPPKTLLRKNQAPRIGNTKLYPILTSGFRSRPEGKP